MLHSAAAVTALQVCLVPSPLVTSFVTCDDLVTEVTQITTPHKYDLHTLQIRYARISCADWPCPRRSPAPAAGGYLRYLLHLLILHHLHLLHLHHHPAASTSTTYPSTTCTTSTSTSRLCRPSPMPAPSLWCRPWCCPTWRATGVWGWSSRP